MSAVIGNLLTTFPLFLYINVGLVNGQDHVQALMRQIGREYMEAVAPCRIIRNAYNNYENEMKNFRKIQQKCKSTPRIVGFNEACAFLMKTIFEDEDIPNEQEWLTKQRFIRRVYYSLTNVVGNTPLGELSPMHLVDGLMTMAELQNKMKTKPATAVCQHWSTMADL